MAATLTFSAPVSYVAPTNPATFVYHIDWPGDNLLSPLYHAYKLDLANNKTEIGLYQTLGAAQSACQSDYAGPQAPVKAPQTLFAGGPRQTPLQTGDQIVYASSNFVSKTGDTMTGPLILSADPTNVLGAATKQYVDAKPAHWVRVKTVSASLNAAVASGGILQFDTVDFDTDGFAPTTAPFNAITIPAGLNGVYMVTAAASGSGTQATTLGMGVIVNSTLKVGETNQAISGPTTLNYTLDSDAVEILKFAVGDVVQLKNNSTGPTAFTSVFLALGRLGI